MSRRDSCSGGSPSSLLRDASAGSLSVSVRRRVLAMRECPRVRLERVIARHIMSQNEHESLMLPFGAQMLQMACLL